MAASRASSAPFPAATALSTERLEDLHYSSSKIHDPKSASPALDGPGKPLSYVPGEPSVNLAPAEVHAFLIRELHTPVLDELYTRLWWVARKSGGSIDPLNRQRVKGRDIVPTEDPKLHLVWHHDKIYVKPIPVCLLNHEFWTIYLPPSVDTTSSCKDAAQAGAKDLAPKFDRSVAVGFLRSYAYLVQHRLDLILAREHHLIPIDIDWIRWSTFIAHLRHIDDDQAALRYHYGQLRLSRLNWAVRIFRPRSTTTSWFYEIPHWSISLYLERAIAPLIFAFASLSLVLSSMQVALSVPADGLGFQQLDASRLQAIRRAFWIFPIMLLLCSGAIWVLLLVIPFSVIGWQLLWGFRNRGKAPINRVVEA
ncbi:MAG: hypothetical protein M1816_005777 [Peltula sp. TS41687]|nr:MAG: hypothetical protein M1816_005777 [Peltula sp. TS41687]